MPTTKTRLAVYLLLAVLAGWFLNDALTASVKKRPILDFLKRWWWVPLILDEPQHGDAVHCLPQEPEVMGRDGYPLVDHRRAL